LNIERREIDRAVAYEAEDAARNLLSLYPSSIVLYNPDWHLGVIGIVASRIVEKFYLPTVILSDNNGVLKGSVRSVAGVNVYKALAACASHLIQFGGHEMAAGLSLKIENLEAFRTAFDKACAELLDYDMRVPQLRIDAEIELEQINDKFFSVLQQFEPCGPQNMHPLFLTRNLSLTYPPQLLKEQHLKFFVKDKQGRKFDAIGFNMLEQFEAIQKAKRPVSIVYSIDENEWNNQKSLQLRLRDAKPD
jgi:single-stranded-DNA-specific exonuclease